MHFIQDATIISLLLSVATYATPLTKRDRFSVKTAARNARISGPKAMVRIYRKYGKSIPTHIKAAVSGSGSVTATPNTNDKEYDAQVTIGGQTFNLDFDTGSSDL